jgi:heme-degrading monooxygenase HmoA
MIIRIVQMSFKEEDIEKFEEFFNSRKAMIKDFKGCHHVELWQDTKDKTTFFTYSIWDSEQDLNHYRFSDFFKDTWTQTKAMFNDKAKAWSVKSIA